MGRHRTERVAKPPVKAFYGGKVFDMGYVGDDRKKQFNFAAMRISDNNAKGYVIDGTDVFYVTPYSRTSKRILGDERATVLAQVEELERQ
jgi:hypothetical protein